MSAIRLATPSEVTIGLPNSSNVVYYLVYDFPFNDYAAAAADTDLPSLGDPLLGFGICRSRTVAQELTPNAAIIACRFDLRGYGQWIGTPRTAGRTFALEPDKDFKIPRFKRIAGVTPDQWQEDPIFIDRARTMWVKTVWKTGDEAYAESQQNWFDANAGRCVTGIRASYGSTPSHIFIGGNIQTDGYKVLMELKFETSAEVASITPTVGPGQWDGDIVAVPALKSLQTYAVNKGSPGASLPVVLVVPIQNTLGNPISMSSLILP